MTDLSASDIDELFSRDELATCSSEGIRVLLRGALDTYFLASSGTERMLLGLKYFALPTDENLDAGEASLHFDQEVSGVEGFESGPYLILSLSSQPDELRAFGAALISGILNFFREGDLDASLSAAKVAVEQHVACSRSLPDRSSEVGLFGELCLIALARDPGQMVAAWHDSPYATHDFSIGSRRLEVKSSSSPMREHWISRAQGTRSNLEDSTFASLYVARASGGISVLQLANQISSRLVASQEILFRRKLAEVEFQLQGNLLEFDFETSAASIKYVDGESVPRPTWDSRILSLKWRVSLRDLPESPDSLAFWRSI